MPTDWQPRRMRVLAAMGGEVGRLSMMSKRSRGYQALGLCLSLGACGSTASPSSEPAAAGKTGSLSAGTTAAVGGKAGSPSTVIAGQSGTTPSTPSANAGSHAAGSAAISGGAGAAAGHTAQAGSAGATLVAGSGGASTGAGGSQATAGSGSSAGSGGSASSGSSSLTGTLGALGAVKPVMAGWATTNGNETLVYLSSSPLTCAQMMTMGTKWLASLPAGTQVIEVVIRGTAKVGMVPVQPLQGEVNYAEGSKSSSTEVNASSGSINVTKAESKGVIEGTIDATFAMGSVKGNFHADWCQGGAEY
jgi:hypothetical protein